MSIEHIVAAEKNLRLADVWLADATEAATQDLAMFRVAMAQAHATLAVAFATLGREA